MEPTEVREWVQIAPGIEQLCRPGDPPPTAADAAEAQLELSLLYERTRLRALES